MQEDPKVKVFRVWKTDSLLSILSVMFYILKLRPDIIHFNVSFQSFGKNKLTNATGLSLILLCRLLGFRVVAGVHTLAEVTDLEKFGVKPSLLNRIGILMATKLILSAQSVVVLVRSYSDVLKKRYEHKGVFYIPHGASVDLESKENTNEKAILIFGHMGPHKGLPLMLKAFEKINKTNPNVKLIVAGSNHPNFPNYLDEFSKITYSKCGISRCISPRTSLDQFLDGLQWLFCLILLRPGQAVYFILPADLGDQLSLQIYLKLENW